MARKGANRSDKPVPVYKTAEHRRENEYRFVPIRQRLVFAKEYIRTGNASKAWIAAFPQSIAKDNSRRASASKLLNNRKTRDLIRRLSDKANRRIATSLEEIVASAVNVLRFDPARIHDENGALKPWDEIEPEDRLCITEVSTTETVLESGEIVRKTTVKAEKKHGARDQLSRMMGAYARDNMQKAQAAASSVDDELLLAQRIAFLLDKGIRAGKTKQLQRAPITIEGKST